MIYLDYSATTPVNDEVLDTFCKVTKNYIGNPNSLHKLGLDAKRLIDASTKQIADILKIKETEIIYTSGATESNNTAIKGICLKYQNRGKKIITTPLEHSSVIASLSYLQNNGFEVLMVKLDENGQVDLDDLKNLLTKDVILVTIASVNSEIGIRQDITKIGKLIKENSHAYFHSDITQSIGKEKVDLTYVDLASFSAQKFYGIKGIGCLIKKENIVIDPIIHGGKSTTIYRAGTPNVSLIASISKAMRLAYQDFDKKYNYVLELSNYLKQELSLISEVHVNNTESTIPHIVNISVNNIKPETMQHALEMEDIYVSTKTACSIGEKSTAVYSVTNDENYATHSLRISLSYLTTKEEIDTFINVLKTKIKELS